ncbi:MAG: DUF2182 domain-containing protein [Emcibacter sp.]|nr:DUF2182 domain-containing protein [Emcibacter sp.]
MKTIFTQPRLVIVIALGSVVALAWVYLFYLAQNMSNMDIMSVDMMAMTMADYRPWTAVDFGMIFLMWAIMMVGMMLPSAAPAIMVFDKWNISRKVSGQPYAATSLFILGYIFSWTAFSLIATVCQWALDYGHFLTPMMESKNPYMGAILLVCAGLYQLSPYKDICLKHCHNPIEFIGKYWKKGNFQAFKLGSQHGLYCIGCCWLIMGLLFFFGVMNLMWILILSLFVLLEKLIIFNHWINWTISATLILGGISLLI